MKILPFAISFMFWVFVFWVLISLPIWFGLWVNRRIIATCVQSGVVKQECEDIAIAGLL